MDDVMRLASRYASVSEILGAFAGLCGLLFSLWALMDDIVDLLNVYRYGTVGGPRWVTAFGHFLFNLTLLVGWCFYTYRAFIAVYLPPRADPLQAEWAGQSLWASLIFAICTLLAQIHQRVARTKLRNLPLSAWERMLRDMGYRAAPPEQPA